ncbi:MAG TPA: pYEATS domain-containing protein [Candidatus Angelobacter sp.]
MNLPTFGVLIALLWMQTPEVKVSNSYVPILPAPLGEKFFTITVDALSPQNLGDIRCVEYTLPPTYKASVQRICNAKSRFAFTQTASREFPVYLKIEWGDGHVSTQEYLLDLHSPLVNKEATKRLETFTLLQKHSRLLQAPVFAQKVCIAIGGIDAKTEHELNEPDYHPFRVYLYEVQSSMKKCPDFSKLKFASRAEDNRRWDISNTGENKPFELDKKRFFFRVDQVNNLRREATLSVGELNTN